jgi:hypothetical protein
MGLVKEPQGVDLVVGPSILTDEDKKMISKVIADYKLTGKMPTNSTFINKKKITNSTQPSKSYS